VPNHQAASGVSAARWLSSSSGPEQAEQLQVGDVFDLTWLTFADKR
jgi:hypothetical protein